MVNNSVRCLLPETRSALSKDKESALWILQVRLPRTKPPLTRTTPLQPLIFPFWVGAGRKRNGIQSKPTFNSAVLGTLCVKLQRKGAHQPVRGMRELRLKRNELKLDQETKREILCQIRFCQRSDICAEWVHLISAVLFLREDALRTNGLPRFIQSWLQSSARATRYLDSHTDRTVQGDPV